MAEEFLSPEKRGAKAAADFANQYRAQLAITLKKSWNKSKMELAGWDHPNDPSDKQFEAWADELIDSGQFTITKKDGSKAKPITIQEMQGSLSREQEEELIRKFGTKQLRDVILTREQLNNAAQQVGQGTYNNSGRIPFLGGATIIDAIIGFFEWMFSGFPRGKDGGIFSGLKETIAKRAINNTSSNVNQLLAQNAPTIHQGVRNFISGKIQEKGEEMVGLRPATPDESIGSVKVGQDVKPGGPPASDKGEDAPPVAVTGKPEVDLPARFGAIVDRTLAAKSITLKDVEGRGMKDQFDKAVKAFKEEGTKLAMDPEGQKLSKEEFAKKLIANTKQKLIDGGMDAKALDDTAMQKILEEMQRQIEADYDNIIAVGKGQKPSGPTPPAPQPPPSGKGLIEEEVETKLDKSLNDPAALELMNMVAGKPMGKENIQAIKDAVAPVLARNAKEGDKTLIGQGSKAYDNLSKEIFDELVKNETKINPAGGQVDRLALQVMAKKMAKEYIDKEVNKNGQKIAPDPAFEDKLKADEKRLMDKVVERMKGEKKSAIVRDTRGQLIEEIKSKAMEEITGNRNASSASPGQLIDTAYRHGKIGWGTKTAAKRAYLVDVTREDALVIAREIGLAPNQAQTDYMSNLIADAAIDVSTRQDFKGDQAAYEKAVRDEVAKRLSENRDKINGMRNSSTTAGSTVKALWRHGSSLTWQQYANEVLPRSGYQIDDAAIREAADKAAAVAGGRFQTEVAPLQDKVRGKGFFPGEAKATTVQADATPTIPGRTKEVSR